MYALNNISKETTDLGDSFDFYDFLNCFQQFRSLDSQSFKSFF